ncbi:gamma-crystallin 2-like isoform X2 [Hyla sarda]|uniref:gamma-crystallin 2-like isoform X2 n=1 Tax=Hyla sarda TaxID=327740 RepID=UPI0024C37C58|nr:gamma-crystallin 2-like isoform X2 [Hyla sarda]
MERKRLRKELEKLLADYVGTTLRENEFDSKGRKESSSLDDLAHYDLAIGVALQWFSSCKGNESLEKERLKLALNHHKYPNRMEREAMILSSFAGMLMGHLTQPFNLSLHPFAMLTAPQAAKHALQHCVRMLNSSGKNEAMTSHDQEVEDDVIIFYEDRNFQGRSFECSSDSSDLLSLFNHCGSIRVEHGNWMIYEFPNYRGCQYFLKRGEYPDFNQCLGFGDTIRSCRIIPQQTSCKIRVYEREDFKGQMMEFTEDCPQVYEKFRYHDIHSCNVLEGHWIFYDEPNYKGRQYYLRPGEYRRYSDWGGVNSRVGSFRRATDFQ